VCPYGIELGGKMRRLVLALAVVLTGFALLPECAQAQKIGVASSVKNDLQRVAPAPSQAVGAGSSLIANEHLRTGEASSAQLLFVDETSVSMGAQSDLVLDRFVYNPNRAAGNVVLSTARGALRFVTGSQNPTNYTINTPVASIGVRGTIAEIFTYAAAGLIFTRVTDVEGLVVVTARSGQVVQLTPGMSGPCLECRRGRGPLQGRLVGDQHCRHGSDVRADDSNNNADLRRSR
jgi:FecR-like protein